MFILYKGSETTNEKYCTVKQFGALSTTHSRTIQVDFQKISVKKKRKYYNYT